MSKKILILDDDKDILEILELILTESGYEIHCLSHGNRIFEEIKEFEPDLILMDVMLGDLDGLSICKDIKEQPSTSNLPVILISATNNLNESINLPGAPNDYLSKPFDIDIFLAMIGKYMNA